MMAPTQLTVQVILGVCFLISTLVEPLQRCQQWNGRRQRNIWGDFLQDPTCLGPNGEKYPKELVNRVVSQLPGYPFRNGRTLSDPIEVQEKLLQSYKKFNGLDRNWRMVRSALDSCNNITTARLCQTEFNTTVPMYGISMTSGEPVTIVQKFPNLLQQIVYEECLSDECDIVHGRCTQTYIPQLFFVLPMGPVTLMGQDYILVESGCVCTPKLSFSIGSLAHQP